VTSQFTVTGVLSITSFAIVLAVGFWKHGLHFFSLFVPHGTPFVLKVLIAPIEFVSFLVRPFSLGLRPFVAMFAGHILLEVFGNFVVQGLNAGIDGMTPGFAQPFADRIRSPLFLAFGEFDVSADPHAEPEGYPGSSDITLVVVPRMAHMHNFAETRAQLWERFLEWLPVTRV
jgi:hypothetical protein